LKAMDDARKLLDSLMGQTRNMDVKEAKKKKGNNFKEDDVCKFHLLGFCPIDQQLFRNTKRHLGDCEKVHSDALKEEYEEHPQKEEYQARYLKDAIRYLEGVVRTADEAVARVKRNIEAANKDLEEKGPNDVAKQEIEKIRERCNGLLKQAEELAEAGDIAGSKEKHQEFEETKAKADEWEQRCKVPMKEEVCEICGLRPEDGDGMRKFAHTEGKIHIGFVVIRDWLNKFREQATDLENKRGKRKDRQDAKKDDKDQNAEGARDRDRNRERDSQPEEGERRGGNRRRDDGRDYRNREDHRDYRSRGGRDGRDRGETDRRNGGDRATGRSDRNLGGGYRERSRSRDLGSQRRY